MTATYIAAFVGARHPDRVNTERIAQMVQIHPTRSRRIVSKLVKAGILASSRGGSGGVSLAKPADKITLAEIYDAIQETSVLTLGLHNPFSAWSDHCFVHETFEKLMGDLEFKLRDDLARIKLSAMFKPWAPEERQRPKTKRAARG